VEILVLQVGTNGTGTEIYRISFDGSIFDEKGFTVIGGKADTLYTYLKANYQRLPLKEALALCVKTLSEGNKQEPQLDGLEVAILERNIPGRAFRRLTTSELLAHFPKPAA
jgi:proteasome alpha subunit